MCIFLSMCSSVKGKTFIKNFPSNAEKIFQFSVKIRNYPNIWTFSPQKLNNSVIYPTSGWNSPQKFILPNLLPRWLDNGHTPYYIFIHSVWNDKKSINILFVLFVNTQNGLRIFCFQNGIETINVELFFGFVFFLFQIVMKIHLDTYTHSHSPQIEVYQTTLSHCFVENVQCVECNIAIAGFCFYCCYFCHSWPSFAIHSVFKLIFLSPIFMFSISI